MERDAHTHFISTQVKKLSVTLNDEYAQKLVLIAEATFPTAATLSVGGQKIEIEQDLSQRQTDAVTLAKNLLTFAIDDAYSKLRE